MSTSQENVDKIVELHKQGVSSRSIAEVVLGNKSKKSTVNDIIKRANELDTQCESDDLDVLCESKDKDLANLAKRLRTAQRANTQLRRVVNGTSDKTQHFDEMIEAVEKATAKLKIDKRAVKPAKKSGKSSAVAEILFSDYQIGKVGQHYNSKLAEMAMVRYSSKVMDRLVNQDKYDFDKIIIASIGDLVEDHMKHGVQSATSTDCGLSEQMALAITHMWEYLIQPIGNLGVPTEIVCVAGNHGSSGHKGMDMFKAGLFSYDYAIYKALEGYCKVAGYDHVKFIIPEGCFGYTTIFGRLAVYEHGYFNTCTEKSLEDQSKKRGSQLKRHVDMFRCGDMHHLCNFDNGRLVVNGAFFGADTEGVEYSGILGFNAVPAQIMMIHTDERSLGRNTVKETYNIQVADGY